jgi:hypothetical protein
MKSLLRRTALFGLLLAVPAFAMATPHASGQKTKSSTAAVPTHATKGTVKSIDDTKLVITRSPKGGHEMSFVVNPSTQRQGDVAVGSTVEVRYHTEASKNIATTISVQSAKKPA